MIKRQQLDEAYISTKKLLLNEMNAHGFWEGRLSSSPLSTAVAIVALAQVDAEVHASAIKNGLQWLDKNINPDGGWGDSPKCKTNLSTTLLCWSALSLAKNIGVNFKNNDLLKP